MYLPHQRNPVAFFPYGRKAVAAVPKVGQTYVRTMADGPRAVDPARCDDVIVFVRDPIERLESCFHYFNTRFPGSWPVPWHPARRGLRQIAPTEVEDFIDLVLAGVSDKHWAPQSEMWGYSGENVVFHRYEDFGAVMETLGRPSDRVINTSGVPISGISYRIPELRELFSGDLNVRESI